MTKYELYQILDENGFEPSEENLNVLVEGLEDGTYVITEDGMLYEGIIGNIVGRVAARRDMKAAKAEAAGDTATAEKLRKKAKKVTDFAANHRILGKSISAGYAASAAKQQKKENQRQTQNNQVATARDSMNRIAHQAAVSDTVRTDSQKGAEKVDKRRKEYTSGNIVQTEAPKKPVNSDFELYRLLDQNGFEPTNENLDILKENLENGSVVILNADDLSLSESMSEDYLYMQILANNGFKTTYENVKVLKEALENGHVLLEAGRTKVDAADEAADEARKATMKQVGKNVKRGVAIAGGVALGAMIGAGVGHGIKAAVGNEANKAAEGAAKTAAEVGEKATAANKAAEEAAKTASDATAAKDAVKAKEGVTADEIEKAVSDETAAKNAADKAKSEADEASKKATEANETAIKKKGEAEKANSRGAGAGAAAAGAAVGGGAGGGIAAGVYAHRHKGDKTLDDEIKDIKTHAAR